MSGDWYGALVLMSANLDIMLLRSNVIITLIEMRMYILIMPSQGEVFRDMPCVATEA
ncbi:hypothetical protein HY30_06930 [Hyphomonas chukchiensis]|uniref:Uncharacterized protein n=1 Tax=Hyphomonas chukchiensis TaxID=1280947 RepID=A0A062UHB6_9PROT|nr:hypothetical protein HY30_06930 [Hyphomonas chukchiensis]